MEVSQDRCSVQSGRDCCDYAQSNGKYDDCGQTDGPSDGKHEPRQGQLLLALLSMFLL